VSGSQFLPIQSLVHRHLWLALHGQYDLVAGDMSERFVGGFGFVGTKKCFLCCLVCKEVVYPVHAYSNWVIGVGRCGMVDEVLSSFHL